MAVGSASQLTSYASAKHTLLTLDTSVLLIRFEDNATTHVVASLLSSLVVTTCMNPFDVVSTRLYSQQVVEGHGVLYRNYVDCVVKVAKMEGLSGFCKGWVPQL